jgi:hypothetical protein
VYAIGAEEDVAFNDIAVVKGDCCFMGVDIDNFAGSVEESWFTLSWALGSFFESFVEVCAVDKEPAL